MNVKEKVFNTKLYAALAFSFVAVFLVLTTVFAFRARYTAFHPDELVKTYVNSIVNAGDGYNAYKNTIVSKNMKYGDFIRKNFITPAIERDMKENSKSYSDEAFKGEKTLNDDGTLSGKLIDTMFPVYKQLVESRGWDNYSAVFSEYIERLIEEREKIFSDKFFDDEVFFSAFEANVSQYTDMLTGTEEVFDENTGVKLSEKTTGLYEEMFGENYVIKTEISAERAVDTASYCSEINDDEFSLYGITADEITEVRVLTADVRVNDSRKIASVDVTLVKIGSFWYVDNTRTDTSSLYELNSFLK